MYIVDKHTASAMLGASKYEIEHVLSLGEDDKGAEPGIVSFSKHKLRLEFLDLEQGLVPLKDLLEGHKNPGFAGCTKDQVKQIISFAMDSDPGKTLVHCSMGVSRSTAAALICNYIASYGAEYAVDQFMRDIANTAVLGLRPHRFDPQPYKFIAGNCTYHPNRWMLYLVDEILDSNLLEIAQNMLPCYKEKF